MKKIAIVGFGYVGRAMCNFFKDHYIMYIRDPYVESHLLPKYATSASQEDVNSCDLAVVCVPTPRSDNGKCDTAAVERVIAWIDTPLILLKSTIEIGTTEKLKEKFKKRIVFSPEYCGESTYYTPSPYDFNDSVIKTPFFIFGGDPKDTSEMIDFFSPVAGPVKRYVQTNSKTAELVKYMENSFYAAKIAFCYEVYEICQKIGVDWNTARELWLLDPRINSMHTSVFEKNEWPFSGKCLPKDISALVEFSKDQGYEPELLKEVIKTNKRIHDIRQERKK